MRLAIMAPPKRLDFQMATVANTLPQVLQTASTTRRLAGMASR